MNKIRFVIERDIQMFLRYRFILIMRAIWFTVQISLFGLVVSNMMSPEVQTTVGSYFNYYAAGVGIMMLYSTSMFIGYDIFEEAEHGIIEYLLSLPISRKELVLGRAIGGGIRSFVYVGPMLAIVLLMIGAIHPLNFIVALTSLFLFAFGVSGFSITLASGIKSHDKYDIFMGMFNAFVVRLSTAMYPKAFMPDLYANVAQLNPITFASDIFRWGAGLESALTLSPFVAVIGLFIFFFTFTFLGITIYERRIEGGGWE
jgi:ABC-2 type transport system permease protein